MPERLRTDEHVRAPGTSGDRRRERVLSVVLLAAVALVLRLGALFVHRDLSFDDSVYGTSIVAMRHGLVPYRELFASQGPLYFPLLSVGDVVGLGTQNGPRIVPVLAGIVTPILVWATARRLGATQPVALTAGLFVAATGSMLWTTGPATADGPAAAFTASAVYVAVSYDIRPTAWAPLLAGGLLGAGLATKPLMFPALLPVMIWVARRSRRACFGVASAALGIWLMTALPFGLSRVWDQSIVFHLDKTGRIAPFANLGLVMRTLFDRDPLLVVATVLGVVAALALDRPRRSNRADVTILGAWFALVLVVIVFERLMLINHVATLVLPLALLFATRPPPLSWVAVATAVIVPIQAVELAPIVLPAGYHGRAEQVIDAVQSLPPDAQVVSDVPGLVWQSGRSTPRFLNDPSNARIETHRLTSATVLAAARATSTCAVVIWSFRFGNDLPGLRNALRQASYVLSLNYAPDQQFWEKTHCFP